MKHRLIPMQNGNGFSTRMFIELLYHFTRIIDNRRSLDPVIIRGRIERNKIAKRFFVKMTLLMRYSQLMLENIANVTYEWKDDLYNKNTDHHSIYGFMLIRRKAH